MQYDILRIAAGIKREKRDNAFDLCSARLTGSFADEYVTTFRVGTYLITGDRVHSMI